MRKAVLTLLFILSASFWTGCGEIAQMVLVGGAEVPYGKLGINMFPRNRTMGDLLSQMQDIKSLGFNSIRVTFWFDEQYMQTRYSSYDFTSFDELMNAAEAAGLEVVAILGYVPGWLQGNSNWKSTFLSSYVYPVVSRYKNRINYWEVWNEPDELKYNVLDGSADDYFDLLKRVSAVIRAVDPSSRIITAATANIVADGLAKFDWTRRLLELGASQYADILNVHYYSDLDIELSAVGGPMVSNAGMTIWVTETGKKGQSGQKSYFTDILPYVDKSLNPERIFWYCYVEHDERNLSEAPDTTYGLLTAWGGERHDSSLYLYLKGR